MKGNGPCGAVPVTTNGKYYLAVQDVAENIIEVNYDYDDTDNICDDTDNADLQITKTSGEVYLYKHASW